MAHNSRKLNFMIDNDVADELEKYVPAGQRSRVVNRAIEMGPAGPEIVIKSRELGDLGVWAVGYGCMGLSFGFRPATRIAPPYGPVGASSEPGMKRAGT